MSNTYGRNTDQVEWLLDQLRDLSGKSWKRLQDAYAGSKIEDPAEEALAGVLSAEGLREAWFELRAEATAIGKRAATDYAAQTHEEQRTIEHVAAVNAWDGQHEAFKVEVLGPAHEHGFIDAAAGALGVVLSRPYIGQKECARFWAVYEPVLGELPTS